RDVDGRVVPACAQVTAVSSPTGGASTAGAPDGLTHDGRGGDHGGSRRSGAGVYPRHTGPACHAPDRRRVFVPAELTLMSGFFRGSSLTPEELALGRVGGEEEGAVIGGDGLVDVSGSRQEVGPAGVVRLV